MDLRLAVASLTTRVDRAEEDVRTLTSKLDRLLYLVIATLGTALAGVIVQLFRK